PERREDDDGGAVEWSPERRRDGGRPPSLDLLLYCDEKNLEMGLGFM
ncbi:hypothetical protein Tco_0036320, partial [Tanacetum coccineum]